MQLTPIATECQDGRTCPAIYRTDRGTIVVQGYQLGGAELAALGLPDGENAVEIPASLLAVVVGADSD